MSKINVIVKLPAAPGKGADLVKAFDFALENTNKESGTSHYIVSVDQKDPDTIWIYEIYDGQADLDAHMGSDWFKEFGKSLGGLIGGAPEMHFCTPVSGKGL